MHLNADISSALQLLESIKHTIDDLGDRKLQLDTHQDIHLLISLLENPVFRSIVSVQDSLYELNKQLTYRLSILPVDFDITPAGELILNVPPIGDILAEDVETSSSDFDGYSYPIHDNKSPSHTEKNNEGLNYFNDYNIVSRSSSAASNSSKNDNEDLLNYIWSQVESISLVNDGTGLGFGIVGTQSSWVMVKTILPGGVAGRDGRLKSGDHLLQIGDINLHKMNSEEVATVLRQSGTNVRLIVARPIPNEFAYVEENVVPTAILHDLDEVDRTLMRRQFSPIFNKELKNIKVNETVKTPILNVDIMIEMPEVEKTVVQLKKDVNGLGVTIAGYVCEKEELSGIFVKSINKGSAADVSGKIQVNDRIVEVDGISLQGYTNFQAVEVLRNCGTVVNLCLERYLHGPKYEQLQQAIASNETTKFESDPEINVDELKNKWKKLVDPDTEIIVAQISKFTEISGLGISLEGTVDVEDGEEVRPHHYIRSILREGPVGRNGTLKSGDELLEVNGYKLLGMNHHDVVNILKELPMNVCIVCGRNPLKLFEQRQDTSFCPVNLALHKLLLSSNDRLVKAKSDGSLANCIEISPILVNKMKSRSLEPLTGLAMWSSESHVIELVKGEHGLGFSILDYEDPVNPKNTVIVIRSLVPGGVAQLDGRLIPGDRLLFVNDVVLDNVSLDLAVQALKGAPKGIVKIGVAKPLPIPDTVTFQN